MYVGEIPKSVSDYTIFETFSEFGNVLSMVVKGKKLRKPTKFAIVNYVHSQDAEEAMNCLNYSNIFGNPLRMMWANNSPKPNPSNVSNVYIGNLDPKISARQLHDTFSDLGRIRSVKLDVDERGKNVGHGYIQFEEIGSANAAIDAVNGMLIEGKIVEITNFKPQSERNSCTGPKKQVFVRNYDEGWTDWDLHCLFRRFGTIKSIRQRSSRYARNKKFAFITFKEEIEAKQALELNGIKLGTGRTLYVASVEQNTRSRNGPQSPVSVDANLYIKHFGYTMDDQQFKELFSPFGTITSSRIMKDETGKSRGFGFVNFSNKQEAITAIRAMQRRFINGRPLYVNFAQTKTERLASTLAFKKSQIRSEIVKVE